MYLCIASFIPAALSAILTAMFTFVLAILNIILIVVDLLLMLITLKYIRKDIVAYSARAGRMTARTGFFFQTFPIIAYLIIFTISPVELGIVFTTLDYTLFIFWGISFILNVIGAILYKLPKKQQSTY
ncbi:MAG: hypothetical protein EAX91_14405 [Candidatus Lokiarchaeota archaeon]|nr:hypothetical protein [Candidatus Lokiarchaeota archaeon]